MAAGGNTAKAKYTVYDGTAATHNQTWTPALVNQQVGAPGDREFTDYSGGWYSLGEFNITGSTLTVTVQRNSSSTSPLVADAVRIIRVWETSYSYDPDGNLTSTTDPMGNITSTTYDALGRPTVVTDALHTRQPPPTSVRVNWVPRIFLR